MRLSLERLCNAIDREEAESGRSKIGAWRETMFTRGLVGWRRIRDSLPDLHAKQGMLPLLPGDSHGIPERVKVGVAHGHLAFMFGVR